MKEMVLLPADDYWVTRGGGRSGVAAQAGSPWWRCGGEDQGRKKHRLQKTEAVTVL